MNYEPEVSKCGNFLITITTLEVIDIVCYDLFLVNIDNLPLSLSISLLFYNNPFEYFAHYNICEKLKSRSFTDKYTVELYVT